MPDQPALDPSRIAIFEPEFTEYRLQVEAVRASISNLAVGPVREKVTAGGMATVEFSAPAGTYRVGDHVTVRITEENAHV